MGGCRYTTDTVDTIASPAFVVFNQGKRHDTCYTELGRCTFTCVPTRFLLRDRWGGDADLLTDYYYKYGFKKSDFDKASEKEKASMLEDLQFKSIPTIVPTVLRGIRVPATVELLPRSSTASSTSEEEEDEDDDEEEEVELNEE